MSASFADTPDHTYAPGVGRRQQETDGLKNEECTPSNSGVDYRIPWMAVSMPPEPSVRAVFGILLLTP